MVEEGKLSAEDAAELIDAFSNSGEPAEPTEPAEPAEATVPPQTPPPPQGPGADMPPPPPGPKDPFRSFVEAMEKVGKEVSDSVNWQEVAKQARTGAQKGYEALKTGVDQVSKGKLDIPWFGTAETRDVTLPLNVGEGKTLRIENPCGDVKIVGGLDVGSVTARAKFKGSSPEDARAKADSYTLIVEESDHMVVIRQPDMSGLVVDLEIQLSSASTVEVKSQSGDVSVIETKGGCRINNTSGDLKLRGLNGPIEVHSTSGDIRIEESTTPSLTIENKSGDIVLEKISGSVNVRTSSGDVLVKDVTGKTLSIECVSGDLRVDLDSPVTGALSLRTVSGDASLAVPDGCDCRVSLSTLRGTVSSKMELSDEARQDQRITGKLGEGTGTIDISAVTGDVSLTMHDSTAV